MTNSFISSFLSTIGTIIAVMFMIALMGGLIFFIYTLKPDIKLPTEKPTAIVINKPEYKPRNVISTVKPNELQVNHEKLTSFISSNDAIISDYYK